MSKIIKALALSDLHLGELETLLYNSNDEYNLMNTAIDKISKISQGNEIFKSGVEELILIGDILELSEADESEAYGNAKAFFIPLIEKVNPDKIVYIPGNHDHHLWTELLTAEYGALQYKKCQPKIVTDSSLTKKEIFIERCLPQGYPPKKVDVRYPNYLLMTENADYLFDHGHLFSTLINFLCTKKAQNLHDAEERSYRFMERLWYRKKGTFLQKVQSIAQELFWDYFRRLKLEIPHYLKSRKTKTSSRKTKFREDCTPLLDDSLRKKILWYLADICGIQHVGDKDFHFVFGHTHNGGRLIQRDRKIRFRGKFISIWNTGGWIVPSEVFSPDAYIFYIKRTNSGEEPNLYKLVSRRSNTNDEGDYPRIVLEECHKRIGRV